MNSLGKAGEELARRLLESKGYEILAQNFFCKNGELDLVARKGRLLAFVEVKARATNAFGGPLAAVTAAKRRKIALTAAEFLKANAVKFDSIRFDVICITGGKTEHVENAFFPPRMNL